MILLDIHDALDQDRWLADNAQEWSEPEIPEPALFPWDIKLILLGRIWYVHKWLIIACPNLTEKVDMSNPKYSTRGITWYWARDAAVTAVSKQLREYCFARGYGRGY